MGYLQSLPEETRTITVPGLGGVVISSVYSLVDCSVPTHTSYVVLMSNTCLTNLNNKTVISTNVLSISLHGGRAVGSPDK